MRKWIMIILGIAIWVMPAYAQQPDCSARGINRQVDSLYNDFLSRRSEVDPEQSAEAVNNFIANLNEALTACGVENNASEEIPLIIGTGTEEEPFGFMQIGDAGNNISIQTTAIIRPADDFLRGEVRVLDPAPEGMEYVVITINGYCAQDSREQCRLEGVNFRLVGDSGTLYDPTVAYYDQFLNGSIVAGRSREGSYPFLIDSSETNLLLLYYPETILAEGEPLYYRAQSSIDIVALSQLRVRSGPSLGYPVVSVIEDGGSSVALGRNEDGTWIQVPEGWVYAEYVEAGGDLSTLPVVEAPE